MNLSRRTWVLLCLSVLTLLFIFSFFHKAFNGDEAIIGEFAYSLDKFGYVKAQMFDGMGMGWEKRMYHYHKFFVRLGSWVIHLFGVSLFALRSVSLLFFLLFLYFLKKYFRERRDVFDENDFLICVLILLLNNFLFDYSFLFRPEMMIMSLGFISFYLLQKGLKENWYAPVYISAVLAGLCAFTHLNGLIFIFAGAVLLLFQRRYSVSLAYGAIGGLVALLYFSDLRTTAEFQAFLHQFTNDPNLSKADFKLYSPLLKIFDDHRRFFHSPKEISFSVLFLLSLILCFRSLQSEHRPMTIYLFALIIGLAAISHGPIPYYALLYYPYMALAIVIGIKSLPLRRKIPRQVFIAALAVYGLTNIYYISRLLATAVDVENESEHVSRALPKKNVKVMASEFFFFDQIQNYRICLPLTYEIVCKNYHRRRFNQEDFFSFAQDNGNEYIIISRRFTSKDLLNMIGYDALQPNQKMFGYSVRSKDENYLIFERILH